MAIIFDGDMQIRPRGASEVDRAKLILGRGWEAGVRCECLSSQSQAVWPGARPTEGVMRRNQAAPIPREGRSEKKGDICIRTETNTLCV